MRGWLVAALIVVGLLAGAYSWRSSQPREPVDANGPATPPRTQAPIEQETGSPEAHNQAAPDAAPFADVKYSAYAKRALANSLPQPLFREVAGELGIAFRHVPNESLWRRRSALEVPLGIAGGGVSSEDFDGDGWIDLYFAGDGGGRLYRNIAGERFEDVTAAAGLGLDGETRAGYFVDYDNDGDLDLFLTLVWQSNRLYRNEGEGRFVDVTEATGLLGGKDITHEAVWFDMENDGLLDLYTANFGNWAEGAEPTIGRMNVNAGPNRLYRHRLQDGKHVFVEVGEELGVADRGWTHCVGAWDLDGNGFTDLMSLNDFGASLVYRNIDGQRFEEVSRDLGLDTVYNAMNFTLLDLAHNGRPAIYVSEIMKPGHRQRYLRPTERTRIVFTAEDLDHLRATVNNCLFQAFDDGFYEDLHDVLLEPAALGWAWDASAFDFENDGDLELLVLNGTESRVPSVPEASTDAHAAQRAFLAHFDNERNVCFFSEDGYFYNLSNICPLAYEGNSRGSAMFDFDRDGDLDVAINDYNAPAKVFENLQDFDNHWIRLRLQGSRSNRNAIGATIELRFGDSRRFAQVVSGSGFLSQNPLQLHFGLGGASQVDEVIIKWPSGTTQRLADLAVDTAHEIREVE